MGKRIERIFADSILLKLPIIVKSKATIILKNEHAYFVKIIDFNDSEVFFLKHNKTPQSVKINDIQEIHIDKIAVW